MLIQLRHYLTSPRDDVASHVTVAVTSILFYFQRQELDRQRSTPINQSTVSSPVAVATLTVVIAIGVCAARHPKVLRLASKVVANRITEMHETSRQLPNMKAVNKTGKKVALVSVKTVATIIALSGTRGKILLKVVM